MSTEHILPGRQRHLSGFRQGYGQKANSCTYFCLIEFVLINKNVYSVTLVEGIDKL